MVRKYFPDLKKNNKGITLIEIVVVIFIITIFSMILIANFPKIQNQFALSRATYKLAQDLRKTEDLGLSGLQINDGETPAQAITTIKGYGVYVSLSQPTQYVIYADIDGDQCYQSCDYASFVPSVNCSDVATNAPHSDCVVGTVDVSQDNPSLYIKDIEHVNNNFTSINFEPPNPVINIDNLCQGLDYNGQQCQSNYEVGIVLGLHSDNSAERTVWVNMSGLISVQ